MTHIVKRRGYEQQFDERKLYASIYAACFSADVGKEQAAAIADLVIKKVKIWIDDKKEVTSDAVFKVTTEELKHLNKDAALMYTTHRDIS